MCSKEDPGISVSMLNVEDDPGVVRSASLYVSVIVARLPAGCPLCHNEATLPLYQGSLSFQTSLNIYLFFGFR